MRKLGERVLPEVIPTLERGLDSPSSETRQGVCLGLSEVLASTPRQQLSMYLTVVIPAVRKALCDKLPEVCCYRFFLLATADVLLFGLDLAKFHR